MDSNVKLAVLQPPPRLSGAQARRLCEKIAQQAKNLRNLLMQLRDGEGWVALGYASWARCCETEFGYSKRHANRLIQAAEISQQVGPMGPASLPERQARELARVPEEQRQEVLDVAVENAGDKPLTAATIRQAVQDVLEVEPGANGTVHVGHNSGNNEWYTPPTYIEAARDVMGGIDCDPASSEIANRTVDATTFYTIDQDGLVQKWGKRVWMNPPYAQPHVADFAKAIIDKHTSGEVAHACVLVNNATETGWFQSMLKLASRVCFLRGRVKYLDPSGTPSGAPLQGQVILYFGDNGGRFTNEFSKFGPVLLH